MTLGGKQPEIRISSTQKSLRIPRKKIVSLVEWVARKEKIRLSDVEITIVGSREIARLNRQYLQHAGATDVISFDLTDATCAGISTLIVVCSDVAIRQAKHFGHGPQRELLLYIVHGLLHQMGYDDQEPAKAARMQARQEQLLSTFLASESPV